MHAIRLQAEKTDLVLSVEAYKLSSGRIFLIKPEGNILASMRFLKSNTFTIHINGRTYENANIHSYDGDQLAFDYKPCLLETNLVTN